MKSNWLVKKRKHRTDLENTHERRWSGGTNTTLLTTSTWGALNGNAKQAKILWIVTEVFSNQRFLPRLQRLPETKATVKPDAETISSWSYDLEGHAKKCVEKCELANETTEQLYKVATPCMDDHQFKEENGSVGELSTICSHIVLKCVYLARIGRLDILWSVNKLAWSITKWTKAFDKWLSRLISYIHHTSEYKQYCHVGNTAKQCRLGLFQDFDFAEDFEDSKSTSGGILCIFGSHTFVQKVGCARNRLQFHTVLQKLR